MTRTSSSVADDERTWSSASTHRGLIVALVGVDGSGKSTIVRELVSALRPAEVVPLYMGQAIASGGHVLPTTALMRLARARLRSAPSRPAVAGPSRRPTQTATGRRPRRYSRLRSTVAMANRLLEAWWRGRVAARHRRRGRVVVYDRYLPLEAIVALADRARREVHHLDRAEHRITRRLVPAPDMVVHLDLPGELAVMRKGESSARRLDRWGHVIREWGDGRDEYVRVDASRPVAEVLADVGAAIDGWLASHRALGTTSNERRR